MATLLEAHTLRVSGLLKPTLLFCLFLIKPFCVSCLRHLMHHCSHEWFSLKAALVATTWQRLFKLILIHYSIVLGFKTNNPVMTYGF